MSTRDATGYETTGRSAQKGRTRAALVAAARKLVADGVTPTVEQAAAAASISRTTAYRYFPTKRGLLLAAHPEVAATSMLPALPPTDPGERLDAVVRAFTAMIIDTEAQQRTMLRLSLEDMPGERADLPLRQGRAIGWIHEALETMAPAGGGTLLSDAQLQALVHSVRTATGIEALVWLVDIAGLERSEAAELMAWMAKALYEHALTDPPPTSEG